MRSQGHSWEETRDRISEEITSGRLAADSKLPSEPELCVLYGARRHSLRKALAALVAEGKLRVEHGRGTFVERAPLLNYVIGTRTRFRENLMAQGLTASGETLSEMTILASERVARALGIDKDAPVFARSWRGFANDLPISMGWAYHDAARFPDLQERRHHTPFITEVYRSYGITDYHRQRTTVFTRMATEHEAGMLMLRPGQSVLVVQKIDADLDRNPICFSEAVWAGDRVQFTFEPDQPTVMTTENASHV
ncbi:phosphonate metabolism transcriptional regulator PhnF [Devosia marina]|uniref:Phosphonate metabolism transcriptional regulator PhnF n=1 Tax=Devosia marina TaxID=2683198 RepID=A0A7X3K4A4_9HYPH|nr:phosphonate metabolism transcriptional regulator PhnF [Devosia marina]MVS99728.1 phosphonate metabolism transcriptional regulator PhnF [Devosia marina]